MDLADRIKDLLGQGLSPTVVAAAVGCDVSYVSQLMEHEDFKQAVLVKRAEKAEGAIARDADWDEVERLTLKRAKDLIPLVTRPNDLVRIAAMANAAKRRAGEFNGAGEITAPVVPIVLPQAAAIHFQMNVNAQVVAVEGRSMLPMSTQNLVKQLSAHQQQRLEQFKEGGGVIDVPVAVTREREKVESVLESIGMADEPPRVQKVIA